MRLTPITISILVLGCLTVFAFEQNTVFEYGQPGELKGVKSIFVYTGSELEVRNNIVKNIQKKLPELVIASNPEEADVILIFFADSNTYFSGLSGNSTIHSDGSINSSSSAHYRSVINATGQVGKWVGKNRIRLLMDFSDSRSTILEKRPSTNFARAFVKAYEMANKAE
jgi:hypothetical protein